VRTFSCTDGHEQTPRVAHELGLKTLVGAWLGTDAEINEREIQGVIEVARAGHADIVAVGNEVLLREDLSEDELLACIQRVKDAAAGRAGGLCRRLLPVREAPAHHRRLRRGDDQLLPLLGRLPA
jgi:exo-beta-1,3-glucanase (GH17 family)